MKDPYGASWGRISGELARVARLLETGDRLDGAWFRGARHHLECDTKRETGKSRVLLPGTGWRPRPRGISRGKYSLPLRLSSQQSYQKPWPYWRTAPPWRVSASHKWPPRSISCLNSDPKLGVDGESRPGGRPLCQAGRRSSPRPDFLGSHGTARPALAPVARRYTLQSSTLGTLLTAGYLEMVWS